MAADTQALQLMADALAANRSLPLQLLELRHVPLGAEAVSALVPALPALRSLTLAHCEMTQR